MENATQGIIRLDLRRRRVEVLVAAVMEEVVDTIPREYQEDLYQALLNVLYRNGACIMTDQDRADMGLEPRDDLGWTPSERIEAKRRRDEIMYQVMNLPFTVKEE